MLVGILRIIEVISALMVSLYLIGRVALPIWRHVRAKLLLLTALCMIPAQSYTATYTASSCAKSAVDAAIASASDGDTVQIPACGSTTWASQVTTSKGITIQGAGIAATTINNNGFDMTAVDGKSWRITGMTLTGTACINALTESKSWRVDHIHFNGNAPGAGRCENRVIWIEPTGPDYTKGLIDHNTFTDPGAIQIHMRASGDGGNGEWIRALGLGTDDAVYIEDNQFLHSVLQISNPITDCDGGGRLVYRYNYAENTYFEMHDAIVGGLRSCRKWEVYNNTFEMTYDSGQFAFIGIRGGTGVVFNNTSNSNGFYINDSTAVALYRLAQAGGDPWDNLCSLSSGKATLASTTAPAGCTGTANGCITMDGSGTGGYPCRDQFGFDGNDPQTSHPALFWNNTLNGSQHNTFIFSGPSNPSSFIVENRDWCKSNTASPPASCNGVTTTYTAYTYPHPLQGNQGPGLPGGSIVIFLELAYALSIAYHLRSIVLGFRSALLSLIITVWGVMKALSVPSFARVLKPAEANDIHSMNASAVSHRE